MDKSVSIIGAGLAGLTAAARLSKLGFKVRVFEQSDGPGGKMNEVVREGFRFDTGPSLLTMPFVVDELFDFCGARRDDFLEFSSVDPSCRYFFPDGSRLDTWNDQGRMEESIREFAPEELENFRRFLRYSERLYNVAGEAFLFQPIHEIRRMLNRRILGLFLKVYKIDPFRTMDKGIRSFFSDERLIQLFDRYATYNGSDPFRAPATLNIIPYVEHQLGAFYIKGGMYRLVKALEELAVRNAAEFFYSTPVLEIIHRDKLVRGVETSRKFVQSDYVIGNLDVVSAHNTIIKGFPEARERLNQLEPSLGGMVFLWGVKGSHEKLAHHNILFSSNYREEFRQIFQDSRPADDATVYIAITSKSDPDHAPGNSENWFVLVNMPYMKSGQDWTEFTEITREMILKKLKKSGISLDKRIINEKIMTPETFARKYNAHRGSIYGLSSNDRFSAFMRPANRSRLIDGLYFAGGSAHPGGGIPLVMLSGRFAAELIASRENPAYHRRPMPAMQKAG